MGEGLPTLKSNQAYGTPLKLNKAQQNIKNPSWVNAGPNKNQIKPKPSMTTPKPSSKMAMSTPSYKKGGKVKKTGMALVHKGEMVVPKRKGKKMPSLAQVQASVKKTMGY